MALETGQIAPDFSANDIFGKPVRLSDLRGRRVLLSFFRFIACPFCNLRVHELIAKLPTLQDSLEIVAVFQSHPDVLRRHRNIAQFSVHVIGDLEMKLFRLYQGELSTAKFFTGHARHMGDWVKGVQAGAFDAGTELGELRLVPAEMLIDEYGIIQRAFYGRDVTDRMPLSEITRFARETVPTES